MHLAIERLEKVQKNIDKKEMNTELDQISWIKEKPPLKSAVVTCHSGHRRILRKGLRNRKIHKSLKKH